MARRLVLFFVLGLSLVSCSEISNGWLVLQGNAMFQRGEFQKSALNYLSVSNGSRSDDEVPSEVAYNLGNVYNALGEANTAMAIWKSITDPGSEELQFRLAFNRGHLQFQRGEYADAYSAFRTALLLKPSNLEAKKNLELSLQKVQSFGVGVVARPVPAPLSPKDTDKAMLDYINRLEGSRWKANNQPEASSPSYLDW